MRFLGALSICLAFVVGLLIAGAACAEEDAANLLSNPSFEDPLTEAGAIPYWTVKAADGKHLPLESPDQATLVHDPTQAHSGDYFLKLAHPRGKALAVRSADKQLFTKAALLEFSAWVRGRPGTCGFLGNFELGAGAVDFRIERDEWTRVSMRWRYDGKNAPAAWWPVTLMMHRPGEKGQIDDPLLLVDDIAVREVTCGLADPFGSQMVLQRDKRVPIWGWAKRPGQSVVVRLGKHVVETKADAEGRWQAEFAPQLAGGPYTIELSGWPAAHDVMLGDVWLCLGQSNMEMGIDKINGVFGTAPETTSQAEHPQLRLWHASKQVHTEPQRALHLRQSGGRNGWQARWMSCSPQTVRQGQWGGFSAVGYFFGREIQADQQVAIGLMQIAHGGTSIEAWMSPECLAQIPVERRVVQSIQEAARQNPELIVLPELPESDAEVSQAYREALLHHGPKNHAIGNPPKEAFNLGSACYNGQLSPLFPFAVKGILWYQGEHNGGDAHYQEKLTAQIADWRQKLDDPQLPIIVAQLCNWGAENDFQVTREAQLRTVQQTPHTALAVTIDLADREGDGYGPKEIHPKNKQEVGRRMALAAQAIAYGKSIEHSGPLYRAMTLEEGKIRLHFDHAETGLAAHGGELIGFMIAGETGDFVPAEAQIDSKTVLVSSPDVPQPTAVRYGYQGFVKPLGTLTNSTGLPASPFRAEGAAK